MNLIYSVTVFGMLLFGNTKQLYGQHSFSGTNEIEFFVCDSFVSKAFDNYTIKRIQQVYSGMLGCNKQLVTNVHDPDVTDTLYTFSDAENTIGIYRAKHNDFIFAFDVADPIFNLTGNVKPGMTKDEFLQNFGTLQTLNNMVLIGNSEGNTLIMFCFNHSRLVRITCSLYLD